MLGKNKDAVSWLDINLLLYVKFVCKNKFFFQYSGGSVKPQ